VTGGDSQRQDSLTRQLQGAIRRGTGSPQGVVTAPVGSIYLRTDGGAATTLYVKESGIGATGWVAK
jgi:hypothetical protein